MDIWSDERMVEIDKVFERLVPCEGPAETVAGEIVRAVERILYRYFNDGDRVGIGYGNETCNAACRYLEHICEGTDVDSAAFAIFGVHSDVAYEKGLLTLVGCVLDYLKEHPECEEEKNEDDMWNYSRPEDEFYDDEEGEEDEGDYDYYASQMREDLTQYPPLDWRK